MPFRRVLLLWALAAIVGFAPAPFPRQTKKDKKQTDLEAMRGTWKVVEYETGGRPLGHANLFVKVEKQRWQFYRLNGGVHQNAAAYDLRLDPTGRPPAFDWIWRNGPNPMFSGSYRLEEKRLTIIFTGADRPRPTDFNLKGQWEHMVLVRP